MKCEARWLVSSSLAAIRMLPTGMTFGTEAMRVLMDALRRTFIPSLLPGWALELMGGSVCCGAKSSGSMSSSL